MKVAAWDSRTDRYEIIEADVALNDSRYLTFHPLSENQMNAADALEDAMESRLPEVAALALIERLRKEFYWKHHHLKAFVRQAYLQIFPPGPDHTHVHREPSE